MSERNIRIDFSGGIFVLGMFVLIILFWGEPDLHDALIHQMMQSTEVSHQSPTD
ncbi:MAG: hypothetical protein O2780_19665 [Proteobacteria bacterium]|jgi:hypothetical protein|nr:hypothetical protein [Pseudomonadota bacterium]MDA1302337.1 hypothetical protein [Pseudomonadota bacterium]